MQIKEQCQTQHLKIQIIFKCKQQICSINQINLLVYLKSDCLKQKFFNLNKSISEIRIKNTRQFLIQYYLSQIQSKNYSNIQTSLLFVRKCLLSNLKINQLLIFSSKINQIKFLNRLNQKIMSPINSAHKITLIQQRLECILIILLKEADKIFAKGLPF
ncbi:hypothetical protein ABPG72_022519 [Tetrahymena utriculariae]